MLPKAVQDASDAADVATAEFDAAAAAEASHEGADVAIDVFDEGGQTPGATEEAVPNASEELQRMSQRYSTIEGKYRAEVPRLHERIRELEAQQRAPVEPPPEVEFDPVEASKTYLKDQEIEDFDTALDTHARLARGAAEGASAASNARWAAHVAALEARLATLESAAVESVDSVFWNTVEAEIPDARTINDADPLFVDFLSDVEPQSGQTYRALGESAMDVGDVGRTVEIFRAYLNKYGRSPEAKPVAAQAEPPVKPGTVKARPAPDAATTKVISALGCVLS